jgi:hypothetical protein
MLLSQNRQAAEVTVLCIHVHHLDKPTLIQTLQSNNPAFAGNEVSVALLLRMPILCDVSRRSRVDRSRNFEGTQYSKNVSDRLIPATQRNDPED